MWRLMLGFLHPNVKLRRRPIAKAGRCRGIRQTSLNAGAFRTQCLTEKPQWWLFFELVCCRREVVVCASSSREAEAQPRADLMELTSSSFFAQSQLDFGKGVVRWPHNQLQLAIPGHWAGGAWTNQLSPKLPIASVPLPRESKPRRRESLENCRTEAEALFNCGADGTASRCCPGGLCFKPGLPGIRDAGVSHLLLTELRCRRPEL